MLSHRPFHTATAFSNCHLSLACAIFLQDLDPCLAYKASCGYLLSFVLNISNEKRQVKELIDLFSLVRHSLVTWPEMGKQTKHSR